MNFCVNVRIDSRSLDSIFVFMNDPEVKMLLLYMCIKLRPASCVPFQQTVSLWQCLKGQIDRASSNVVVCDITGLCMWQLNEKVLKYQMYSSLYFEISNKEWPDRSLSCNYKSHCNVNLVKKTYKKMYCILRSSLVIDVSVDVSA
jgi:hypothetical protein